VRVFLAARGGPRLEPNVMRPPSSRRSLAWARAAFVLLVSCTAALPALAAPTTKSARLAPPKQSARSVPAARGWHIAPPGKTAPVDERGRAMLVLQGLNIPDRVALTPRGERGGFSAEDLDRAAHVMRDSSGNEHPIDPRLLDMVYRLQAHFAAPEIRIISGYRTPRRGKASNHGKGRAMDLVVPGATDDAVAKFARDEGFAGVGIYPVSGFVHVDVRERSYFWVDTSGPGKRSRTRGIFADLAARSDAQAASRGERPVGPFLVGTDVEAALASSAAASHAAAPEEEDEGDAPASE
jgi:uncharacterized protein YcbK (DUF882 family)